MEPPTPTLILTRGDIARLMKPEDYLEAVEIGFRAGASGKAFSPLPMHLPAIGGGFHAKGATISLDRDYAVLKLNGNFPDNPSRRGLPTIQGAILLCDAADGALLAIMDSMEITLRRTAAASALAARLLARPDSQSLLICGCGEQGRAHLLALADILPLTRCYAWDADPDRARQFASDMDGAVGIGVEAIPSLRAAAPNCDVIATCTTSTEPFLGVGEVRPGTFIAAVGADNPGKSEIAPALMAGATIVTDVREQCAAMGDLHHALRAGAVNKSDVYADLGELVSGRARGRRSPDEIIVFDSTGTALQDAAVAVAVYERSRGHSHASVLLGAL